MSKHTPGPWEIIGKTTAQGGPLFIESICKDEHVGPICEIRSNLKYPGCSQEDANGRNANASLIAAAPDLLEALEELLQLIEIERPDWQHTEQHLARAAIAKARGEQQ